MKAIVQLSLLLLLQLLAPQLLRAMTIPPSDKDLKAPTISSREATLTWTRVKPGPASHESLVVLQLISGRAATTPKPVESVAYIANQYFGLGQQIGIGEFVVYADTGRVVVVKGLTPGATYRADVIAYEAESDFYRAPGYTINVDTTATLYFTTPPPPPVPAPRPATAAQATALDCSTLQLSCRPGNGDGRLMVVQRVQDETEGATKLIAPVNDAFYLASFNYGQGHQVGPDAYAVQMGTDSTLTVYGLIPGSLYKFVVYEYSAEKDASGELTGGSITYATAPDTAYVQVSACSTQEPERPATNARQTDTTQTTARVVWRNGSGQGRLVVVRELTEGLLQPTQNVPYRADAQFGQGAQTHPGSYVMMTGADSVLTLTGLQPGSMYQLAVYEYNLAADGSPTYLLSQQPASCIVMTSFPPDPIFESPERLQVGYSVAFTYTRGLVELHWKRGSGTHFLVLAREVRPGREPLSIPQDGTSFDFHTKQEMQQSTHWQNGTYVLMNQEYSMAGDTLVHLRNPHIGHTYEVAVVEYTYDALFNPEFTTPATITFVAARLAPVLQGQTDNSRPSFTWYTDAFYLPESYELEYSTDGTSFLPEGRREGIALDSSVTRVSSSQVLNQPLTAPTFYRLRLAHRDQHDEYSNVVRLQPARPLPVTLTSFNGKVDARSYGVLAWATASETNSEFFELQRSADGTNFSVVGRRPAAGTSTSPRNYQYQDPTQITGVTYYRLRQVDKDAAEYFSAVVALQPVMQPTFSLSVWPNPVASGEKVTARLSGLREMQGIVKLRVRAMASAQLLQELELPARRVVEFEWQLVNYAAGVYLVEIQSAEGRWTTRLLVH